MTDAHGDGRVDGVLGNVAFDPRVVGPVVILLQRAALHFHLVRGLPGTGNHLTDAAHGLRVGGDHAEGTQVMQDVFSSDGFAANARVGKSNVFGNGRIKVVTDHQHVEVLIDRVDGVGPRRVGRGRQHVGLATGLDDVRCVTATSAFGVVSVNHPAVDGRQGVFHKTGFVQGVGVDRHLHVEGIGHTQAAVDRRGGGAPVFVQLHAHGTGLNLLFQRVRQTGVALAEKAQVHREAFGGLQHFANVPGTRRTSRGVSASRRPGATTNHRGDARHQRLINLLRADKVNVRVDTASGEDHALARDDFGTRADDDIDTGLDVRVTGLADGLDVAILDRHIGLDHAPPIHNQGVGDDGIRRLGAGALALAHAITDDLATTELHFFTVAGQILLDADPQLGITEADAVAGGRAVHFRIGLSADFHCSLLPICSETAHDVATEAIDLAFTRQRHQFYLAALARLEAHRGTGSDVETKAACRVAIKLQRRVGLGKVIVGANLHRAITRVGNADHQRFAAFVQLQHAGAGLHFSWNHVGLLTESGCER